MISAKQILLIILLAQAPLVANATMYAYIDADGKKTNFLIFIFLKVGNTSRFLVIFT